MSTVCCFALFLGTVSTAVILYAVLLYMIPLCCGATKKWFYPGKRPAERKGGQ